MIRYDFSYTAVSPFNVVNPRRFGEIFSDIDARLSALETALKAPQPDTPEKPREPGWYWVRWIAGSHWQPALFFGNEKWASAKTYPHLCGPAIIGPRIQEPE